VADTGWEAFGISAEIAKRVYNNLYKELKAPIEIVALPDVPAPASCALEKEYYPTAKNIISAVKRII
jgi:pyruvate dehydrogenase E1 component beta subunit